MWSKISIELLLSLYGQHENLYDTRHRDYLNRVKRANSLHEIYDCLKEINSNVTIEGIKSKIHEMRSQYLKELNEIKASKRSGAGADDVYVPKVWWFAQMEFMRPHTNSRISSSNRSVKNKENENSDGNNDPDSSPCTSQSFVQASTLSPDTPSPCTPGSSKKRKLTVAFTEQVDGLKGLVSKRLKEVNGFEYLSKQVEQDFTILKDQQIKEETAWQIQNILRNAKLEDRAVSRRTTEVAQRESELNKLQPTSKQQNDILHLSLRGILDGEDDLN